MTTLTHGHYAPLLHRSSAAPPSTLPQRRNPVFLRRDLRQRADYFANPTYGRNHRQVAAIVPLESLAQAKKRTLGILQGTAKARFADDFGIDDETLFSA